MKHIFLALSLPTDYEGELKNHSNIFCAYVDVNHHDEPSTGI